MKVGEMMRRVLKDVLSWIVTSGCRASVTFILAD